VAFAGYLARCQLCAAAAPVLRAESSAHYAAGDAAALAVATAAARAEAAAAKREGNGTAADGTTTEANAAVSEAQLQQQPALEPEPGLASSAVELSRGVEGALRVCRPCDASVAVRHFRENNSHLFTKRGNNNNNTANGNAVTGQNADSATAAGAAAEDEEDLAAYDDAAVVAALRSAWARKLEHHGAQCALLGGDAAVVVEPISTVAAAAENLCRYTTGPARRPAPAVRLQQRCEHPDGHVGDADGSNNDSDAADRDCGGVAVRSALGQTVAVAGAGPADSERWGSCDALPWLAPLAADEQEREALRAAAA